MGGDKECIDFQVGSGGGLGLALVPAFAAIFFWLRWTDETLGESLRAGLSWGLSWGLIVGLSFGLAFWLVGGIVTDQIETRTIPNEGMRRSLRSALISLLAFWLAGGVAGG